MTQEDPVTGFTNSKTVHKLFLNIYHSSGNEEGLLN
jgi:hypothetical protein